MKPERKENVLAGLVGAFLGSLIGVACIVGIGQMGYVASISGLVMAVCAIKGYSLLGGAMSRKGAVISCVLTVIMTYFGNRLDFAVSVARLAEVDDVISFEAADATRFHFGGLRGRVVTNPPYGERIMERREAEELYRAFGRAWAKFPEEWKLFLLSSHTEFERTFGKQADKKRKLYNGMLKCDLFMYGLR